MRRSPSKRDRTPPSRALLSGIGHWLAGLLLLLLAGCDLPEIAAPNPAAVPRGPAPRVEAAAVLLGTYSTPIEVADGPSAVTTHQPARPAAVPPMPANSYVLLQVSGRVRLASGPWWPGPARPIATYTAVQTTQATARAQTRVWVRGGAETAPPAGGYEPRFAPAPNGEDRIVLVRTGSVPAQLWTGRDMGGYRITATEGWCTGTHWCSPTEIVMGGTWWGRQEIEAYHVAESNTVSATVIPEPLHVDAPESVTPGQPATMSVRTWGGLRLRHPQIPNGGADVEWRWYPGDTAAVPNPAITPQRLACNGTACTFTPAGGGRMHVVTWVEGAQVETSEIVRVQTAKLTLTCPPTVTRGAEVVCTAAKDPANAAGAITITAWSFDGTPRGDGDLQSLEWRGIMVQSGTVQVKGKIGSGTEQTATATIQVVDREWANAPVMHMLELGATGGEDRVRPLASKISWASDLGFFRAFPEPPPGGEQMDDPITDVQGGPNDGLYYFADLSFPIWGRIRINDAAMSRGSAFYEAQERNPSGGGTRIGGQQWCSNRVVTSVLPDLVRAHERRHAEVYRQTYGEVVRANLPELERMTGTYSELADRYEPLRDEADDVAIDASWAIHELRGNPNKVTPSDNGRECNLKNEDGGQLENPSNAEGER